MPRKKSEDTPQSRVYCAVEQRDIAPEFVIEREGKPQLHVTPRAGEKTTKSGHTVHGWAVRFTAVREGANWALAAGTRIVVVRPKLKSLRRDWQIDLAEGIDRG